MYGSVVTKLKSRLPVFKLIFLVCLFGAGSWVEINGIWVELPILVSKSPQQWSLPSYLTVVIQLANIGPIIYLLSHKFIKRGSQHVITETPVIYFILFIGVIASFLLAFTWKETSFINGKSYSSALIVLSFFLATVDCTSSVTFLPFMAYFPKEYMTAFYVGEGMSGFIPSILALIQGIGKQSYTCDERVVLKNISVVNRPSNHISSSNASQSSYKAINITEIIPSYFETHARYSVQVFFLFISAMMFSSLVAFIALVRMKRIVSDHTIIQPESDGNADSDEMKLNELNENDNEHESKENNPEVPTEITMTTICFLLLLNALLNGLSNGVLPALQSYACLPYGNNIYHLTLTLSAIANPMCCFMYFFVSIKSTMGIFLGVSLYVASAGYTIGIAATSPCPLWNGSDAGGASVLIITVLGVGLASYLKTAISTVLRRHGYKALLWNGISIQCGSLVGALVTFPLVNVYDVFKQAAPCQRC